jgi:TonB family protein
LDRVYDLAEATYLWNADAGWLPEIVMFERETFRIDLEPTAVRSKRIKLRLVVSRVMNKAGNLDRLLDTNLVASFDDPVVAGFSHAGRPYFLSVLVTRTKPAAESQAGGTGPARARTEAVAPLPVRRVEPKIPEGVDPAVLEGEVVLRVSIDAQGKVSHIQVLKSLQPDMDRETVKAVGEWTFEPVRTAAGRAPASFIMSFRFSPPRGETFGDPESGPSAGGLDEAGGADSGESEREGELGLVLVAAADYCRKLADAALDFTCEERIAEEVYKYVNTIDLESNVLAATALKRLTTKTSLLYDYQMIKTAEGIRENRTLLEQNGKPARRPNAPLLTQRFYSYRSLFGPVALFGRERQSLYDYRIIGRDKVQGTEAWVIEAKPYAGSPADVFHGKAWISRGTGRIVRIEVAADSLVGFEKLAGSYNLEWQLPLLTTTHWYEFEKNGILFPSRTTFKEAFMIKGSQRRVQLSKADIRFGNYRFFTVETQTAIKD